MPLVQIKGVSGLLDDQKKQELIQKVTDAAVSVVGEGLRPVTWVLLEEIQSGEWGVGGKAITTECVEKMQTGSSATCAS